MGPGVPSGKLYEGFGGVGVRGVKGSVRLRCGGSKLGRPGGALSLCSRGRAGARSPGSYGTEP